MTFFNSHFEPGDKVLFIVIRAMGDALLATPLIRDFRAKCRDVKIDVIAQELPAQALLGNSNIDALIISPPHGSSLGTYIKLYLQLRKTRYKLSIDLISTPGSALMSRVANASTRIGYKLRGRTWAFNIPVERQTDSKYSAETKYDLVKGFNIKMASPLPEIFPDTIHEKWAGDRLIELGVDSSKILIGISPWSKREWRRWEIGSWVRLLNEIVKPAEHELILFGSRAERQYLRQLEDLQDINVLWAGADHIQKVASLMEHCKFLLTADNGLKHVAVAVSTPTFTIYTDFEGVSPQSWNPPDSEIHRYVIAHEDFDNRSEVVRSIANFIGNAIGK